MGLYPIGKEKKNDFFIICVNLRNQRAQIKLFHWGNIPQ